MGMVQEMVDPVIGLSFWIILGVDILQQDGLARVIFGADIQREITALTEAGNQSLGIREITLEQAVRFEEIAPAAHANAEIHSGVDFQDQGAETTQVCLVRSLGDLVLTATRASRQERFGLG